jgi:hypothetical protein
MRNENWRSGLGHPIWSTNPERPCCSQESQEVERCGAQHPHVWGQAGSPTPQRTWGKKDGGRSAPSTSLRGCFATDPWTPEVRGQVSTKDPYDWGQARSPLRGYPNPQSAGAGGHTFLRPFRVQAGCSAMLRSGSTTRTDSIRWAAQNESSRK